MKSLLTRAELKIMKILWRRERGFIKDILEGWDEEPKPAYNTISTIVRILQDKDFVVHKAYGRTHEYLPTISEADYRRTFVRNALESVFDRDVTSLVSTLVDEADISSSELDELKKLIENAH